MTFKLLIINGLTLLRIIGTIVLIPIYKYFGGMYVGLVSFICYLTDSIDGMLARHFKASTFFGALFDGVSDKLFTIINFIVLYMITPYAIIPIIFEMAIVLVQLLKYIKRLNVKSNIIGKSKVWVLAICVVLTFLISDVNNITFLSLSFRKNIAMITNGNLYFWLLFPAIIMECLTFISYIMEIFIYKNENNLVINQKELKISELKGNNSWENFKNIWLNPVFYNEHKNDANLKDLRKLFKK